MAPPWLELFADHMYAVLFWTAAAEGMGLPVPAEILFVPAAGIIRAGRAQLGGVVAAAVLGNLAGALFGFTMAYMGGQPLIDAALRLVGARPGAGDRVNSFFRRYGPATVFLSRFFGLIRAPAVYAAGASRMRPWQFAAYMAAASLVWNAAWAWLALRYGSGLLRLLHHAMGRGTMAAFGALLLALSAWTLLGRYRRRSPT